VEAAWGLVLLRWRCSSTGGSTLLCAVADVSLLLILTSPGWPHGVVCCPSFEWAGFSPA
jgi:hypothetical protein